MTYQNPVMSKTTSRLSEQNTSNHLEQPSTREQLRLEATLRMRFTRIVGKMAKNILGVLFLAIGQPACQISDSSSWDTFGSPPVRRFLTDEAQLITKAKKMSNL
ncbi:hypothetical protein L596_026567 [Steinernema carpocapsae]|uniref:Uncharacterized protein n=1 Tax=Steinernema carpocapsae TaxID=34508 RepID=A0A4U5M1Q4_STECR|nr:hypothetical protein L596_026567 [Steinernema carpocapsae]